MFSKQLAIKYSSFDHIVVSLLSISRRLRMKVLSLSLPSPPPPPPPPQIGLGGQSLILVYHQPSTPDFSGAGRGDRQLQKFILITGNEAVSRSLFTSIREAASKCPGFMRPIPLNRDDESRIDAIDKELITKLGSNVSLCVCHAANLGMLFLLHISPTSYFVYHNMPH